MNEWLRRRLVWSAVLVLISLGGAGLAAAVDRPHVQAERPELGWRADQRAEPWLAAMLLELEPLEQAVGELSAAGRQALVQLSLPAVEELQPSLAAGDAAQARLMERLATLERLRADEPPGAQPWRLGEQQRQLLGRIDAALAACRELDQSWRGAREASQLAIVMLEALAAHDDLAVEALAGGRDARWADALELLERALPRLDDAEAAAQVMSPAGLPPATAELFAGHRAHDRALMALYAYLDDGGSLDERAVEPLRAAVDAARMPLPTPAGTLQAVLAETALPSVGASLAELEEARGLVADALQPPGEELPEDGQAGARPNAPPAGVP